MLFPLRLALRLLVLLLTAAVLVVGVTATSIWWTARGDDRTPSDAILVLGASQFDGRPSSVLEARLEHALTLFEKGVAPKIVTVGGGRPGDRFTEAEAGKRYLQQRQVAPEDVVAVPEGGNTLRSLEAAQDVLAERGWDTVVLVTDPWHALRTKRMASDVGLEAVSSPTRRGPSVRTRGTQFRYIARETAAYLHYRVFGASGGSGFPAV